MGREGLRVSSNPPFAGNIFPFNPKALDVEQGHVRLLQVLHPTCKGEADTLITPLVGFLGNAIKTMPKTVYVSALRRVQRLKRVHGEFVLFRELGIGCPDGKHMSNGCVPFDFPLELPKTCDRCNLPGCMLR